MPVYCVDSLRRGTQRTFVTLVLLTVGGVIAHLVLCSAAGAAQGSGGGADWLPDWVQKVEVALEDAHSRCVSLCGVEFVHCFRNVVHMSTYELYKRFNTNTLYYYLDGVYACAPATFL